MPFVLGFVGVAAFCVALFVVVSRKNVALACGEHASISTNSDIKKAGISLLTALLIVGSCASFTKAFADTLDGSKLTGEVTVNLNSDYSLNSIHYRINNQTGVDLTGNDVVLLGGAATGTAEDMYDNCGFFGDNRIDTIWLHGDSVRLLMNDFIFRTGFTTEYTATPSDIEDGSMHSDGKKWTIDGIPVAQKIVDELQATGTSETLNTAFVMELSYDAWNVLIDVVYPSPYNGATLRHYLDKFGCFDNTVQDYNMLVSSVEKWLSWDEQFNNYEFVGFNTSWDGTGETVDAAYLASHPITADTTFYAIFKEKTASNDAPSADSSVEPGTPGDVTDTPEPADPDSVIAKADANKDNAEATDAKQNVEGTKEGDQAEQTA